MDKSKRRAILFSLVIAFLFIGTGTILYSEGWRLDFQTFSLKKVGALFVRSFPGDAAITLDGEPIANKSWLLSRGTLISNLFPKTYSLSLADEGFLPWHERISVSPSLVTEVQAVLVPGESQRLAAPSSTPLAEFASSPALLEAADRAWGLGLLRASDAVWGISESGEEIAVERKGKFYVLNSGSLASSSVPLAQKSPPLAAAPDEGGGIFVARRHSILFAPSGAAPQTLASASSGLEFAPEIAVSPSSVAWAEVNPASETSTLVVYDKTTLSESAAFEIAVRAASLRYQNGVLGILGDKGDLYAYSPAGGQPVHSASAVHAFAVSNDGQDIAAAESSALEIIPLNDPQNRDYRRFNLPDAAQIRRLAWYRDNLHIFIVYPSKTVLLDMNDLGLENLTTVIPTGDIAYDAGANILYYLDGGKVMELQFPK